MKARQTRPDAWHQPGYVTRRCLKIIPPFWLCVGLLAIYYCWRDQKAESLFIGLQWIVGLPHVQFRPEAFGFNGSFWNLWVEIGFYVLLPVGFWLLRGRSVRATAGVIAAFFLAARC